MGAIERVKVLESKMDNLENQLEQLEDLLKRFTQDIDKLHERISNVQARLHAMHSLNMRGLGDANEEIRNENK
jgi:phage shock protein A